MRIAVEGCAHGELEIIYDAIREMEKVDGKKIDLLICCGDFQSTRNLSDLKCMAIPDKYKDMCTFYKYYSGENVAPVLTIFIGGNHEASNYLQELPYGGWVAPNIYYMGYANVLTIGGIRIAGLSGIYKSQHWMQGHYERPPYNDSTVRSVYHVRNLEIFRLKQLTGNIDIFLSHDWPSGVTKYGDENSLLKGKPFFKNDIENNMLGSPPSMELLDLHYPSYWFAAHLHCKFAALIPEKGGTKVTKFLALDKCLPKRKFLQILELEHDANLPLELSYDLEWLTILFLTNHLLSVKTGMHYMPGQGSSGRWIYTPTQDEKEKVYKKFNYDLRIPLNFTQTAKPYVEGDNIHAQIEPPHLLINHQTTQFCNTLGVDDPCILLQIIMNNKECRSNEATMDVSLDHTLDSEISASYDDDNHGSTCDDSLNNSSTGRLSPDQSSIKNNTDNDTEYSDASKDLQERSDNFSATESSNVSDEAGNNCQQTEPNCKKFKRRNYSIYSNTL